ncbi:MAG: 4Fe-4S binding protein, partial [Planctomycetota bacterium]
TPDELRELRQENVHVETLVSPVAVRCENGRVKSVTFRRNILGDVPEGGGKPQVIPVVDSEFEVPCDTLIFAIGQEQETEILPEGVELDGGHNTTCENLFVAGDFATENADVISAIGDGKAAAGDVDTYLTGRRRRKLQVKVERAPLTGRVRDHDLVDPPEMPLVPVLHRGDNHEVERGYNRDDTDTHAWRCYLCNHKFEIDQDKCIHCDWCIRVSPRRCILRLKDLQLDEDGLPVSWTEVSKEQADETTYIWIDSDQCIRCGNCINICPVDAISLRKCDRVCTSTG